MKKEKNNNETKNVAETKTKKTKQVEETTSKKKNTGLKVVEEKKEKKEKVKKPKKVNPIKEKKIRKKELIEIEKELLEEHEELEYLFEIEEIEDVTCDVKMIDINKQVDIISNYYKNNERKMDLNVRCAYGEILELLNYMDISYKYALPKKLISFLVSNKYIEYTEHFSPKYTLEGQSMLEETKALLALFNIKYWIKDPEHKKELSDLYSQNNKIEE